MRIDANNAKNNAICTKVGQCIFGAGGGSGQGEVPFLIRHGNQSSHNRYEFGVYRAPMTVVLENDPLRFLNPLGPFKFEGSFKFYAFITTIFAAPKMG
jgi:hypothetical protein